MGKGWVILREGQMVGLNEIFNIKEMCQGCRKILIFLLLFLLLLNLFDIITTFIGVSFFGLSDGNMRVVEMFEKYGVLETILLKIGFVTLYCGFFFVPVYFFNDKIQNIKMKYNVWVFLSLMSFSVLVAGEVVIYVKVVLNNTKIILELI